MLSSMRTRISKGANKSLLLIMCSCGMAPILNQLPRHLNTLACKRLSSPLFSKKAACKRDARWFIEIRCTDRMVLFPKIDVNEKLDSRSASSAKRYELYAQQWRTKGGGISEAMLLWRGQPQHWHDSIKMKMKRLPEAEASLEPREQVRPSTPAFGLLPGAATGCQSSEEQSFTAQQCCRSLFFKIVLSLFFFGKSCLMFHWTLNHEVRTSSGNTVSHSTRKCKCFVSWANLEKAKQLPIIAIETRVRAIWCAQKVIRSTVAWIFPPTAWLFPRQLPSKLPSAELSRPTPNTAREKKRRHVRKV